MESLKQWWKSGGNPDEITWETMEELLDMVEFDVITEELGNGRNVYWLRDRQGVNLGNIESEVFAVREWLYSEEKERSIIKKQIIERIEPYLIDLFEGEDDEMG